MSLDLIYSADTGREYSWQQLDANFSAIAALLGGGSMGGVTAPTILGRITAGVGPWEELTQLQARDLINRSLPVNQTYDLDGAARAVTYRVDGDVDAVPADKSVTVFHIQPTGTIALGARASFIGYGFGWTLDASSANTSGSYGLVGSITARGSGAAKTIYGRIIGEDGFTGVLTGVLAACESPASCLASIALDVEFAGSCGSWFSSFIRLVNSKIPPDEVAGANFGILVDGSANYWQSFLRIGQNVRSAAANLFELINPDNETIYLVSGQGRTTVRTNETYDIGFGVVASAFYAYGTSITVPTGKAQQPFRVDLQATLEGTSSASAYVGSLAVGGSSATANGFVGNFGLTVSGAPAGTAVIAQLAQNSGATGAGATLQANITSAATAATAVGLKMYMAGVKSALNCFLTTEDDGSCHPDYAFLHLGSIGTAARRWNQSAATETAAIDEVLASDGTTVRYRLDYTGKPTVAQNLALIGTGYPLEVATGSGTFSGSIDTGGSPITVYAVPATGEGLYRVTFGATIATASNTTTGTQLGGSTGLQVSFTDPNSVAATTRTRAASQGAANTNTVGHTASDTLLVNAKASTNIGYTYGYATGGVAPSMAYDFWIRVEYLG